MAADGLVHETALVAPVHIRKLDRRDSNVGNNVVVDIAEAAVAEYLRGRDMLEQEWNISIERELGDEVSGALQRNRVIGQP